MDLQALTKRGYLFLETSDFNNALKFFENALNNEPDDAYAYLGKLLVDLELSKTEDLSKQKKAFTQNRNYELAYRFADNIKAINRSVVVLVIYLVIAAIGFLVYLAS